MPIAKKKAAAPVKSTGAAPAAETHPVSEVLGDMLAAPGKSKPKFPPPKKKIVVDDMSKELLAADPSVMLLGASSMSIKIRGVISTQAPTLDYAIGRGGIPLGRLTIGHGGEGSGKTTLALHLAAETQRQGGRVYYIDKEHKLDLDYAAALGVDVDAMYYSTPSHLEQAFEIMAKAIEIFAKYDDKKTKVPHLIVLDSMNAAITKAQLEGEWDAHHMAPQARVYSQSLPKLIPIVSKTNVALFWISQVRKKMNVQYGDDSDIAGGNAPKFYASLILDVKRIGTAKEGEEKVGSKVKITCKKNQISMPFKEAELEISYGRGFNRCRSLLDLAEGHGVVEKEGNWFSYKGEKFANGMVQACDKLTENPTMLAEIEAETRKLLKW